MTMSLGRGIEMTIDVDLSWLLNPEFRHLASKELLQAIEDGNNLAALEDEYLWQPYIKALWEDLDRKIMQPTDERP